MKCDLKKTLIQLLFMVYSILKAESRYDNSITVHGITGENVTVNFKFEDPGINSLSSMPLLHKNDQKIGSCKQTSKHCLARFVLSDVDDNSTATLYIINITLEDEGRYHVSLHFDGAKPLVLSNKITFAVKPRNITNENRTSLNTKGDIIKPETSKAQTFFIYISASVILFICLCMALLSWLLWIYSRKQDNPQTQSNGSTERDCRRPDAVTVSCVEYGELDFQNRPTRDDKVKPVEVTSNAQDGVEYAAIIFPQQKQTPGGRMRDKQRVHPVTRSKP
ncbi:uncharacterized protein LOC130548982 [Triplophysa rosa]|uniref:Immunoglobulin subtype domain-containing protein n=1 Tax=Triplophysa rosa TaxID=992332 RepID=A0A9W7T6Y7_TRIRA|nr:uncharacterized protein LOC130548982 [Triplophysa rosa]KAI7791411.1 hypothetical protein IRJ41_018861 [Triplophysa rosa]